MGPLAYATHLCLQDLLEPDLIYTSSIYGWNIAVDPNFMAWTVRQYPVQVVPW